MADRERIKRNVARMLELGAPEADIDAYLAGEGVSAEHLRAPQSMPQPELAPDIVKSGGIGVVKGTIGLAGLPGDIGQGIGSATDWIGGQFGASPQAIQSFKDSARQGVRATPFTSALAGPTTDQLTQKVEGITGELYEPQTKLGGYAQTIGEFAPAAIGGPGGVLRRGLTQVAAPAVASEAAGQATKGTSGEPFARLVGALAGGLTGVGAANAINRSRSYVPGMKAGTSRVLEKTLTPDADQRLAELGPEGFLLEATPGTFGVAQGILTRPGAAQSTLFNAVKGRQSGANARLSADLDSTLGPVVPPSQIEKSLEGQRGSLSDLYEQVTGLNEPVNLQSIAEQLRMTIPSEAGSTQQALRRVLDMIAPEVGGKRVVRTRPREVLNVRQALDDELKRLGETPKAYRAVLEYRTLIDNALGEAVPDIKVLDSTYSNLMRESEELGRGKQLLEIGKTAIRPEDLIAERASMPAPQRAAQRAGARAEIDRLVGTKANDVTALRLLVQSEGDWNRVKLAEVFGAREADQILKSIDREAAFQNAYNKLIENSQTAQRLGGAKLVDAETAETQSLRDLTIPGMVASTGQKVLRGIRDAVNTGKRAAGDEQLAKALTTTGAGRDRLLRAIRSAQSKREKGRSKTRDLLIQALIGTSAATTDARN